MTTDTTNHHPDPAIHDDDRDEPGLRYSCPNWKLGRGPTTRPASAAGTTTRAHPTAVSAPSLWRMRRRP